MLTQRELIVEVKKAHVDKTEPETFRVYLLNGGCQKGVASKAVTVLAFLREGHIAPDDFRSLCAGYDLTRFIKKGWKPVPTSR